MTVYEELVARGLIAQVTNETEIREMVNNGKATFYIGFDCTADSLTAGHFMALVLMKRLQLAHSREKHKKILQARRKAYSETIVHAYARVQRSL